MTTVRTAACAAAVAFLFAATLARAEGVVDKATGEVDEAKAALAKLVDINAMVAATYTYGFNKPYNRTLNYEVINKANNTFALYDAFLQIARNRDDEDFGFTINMDFGETAKYTGSDWDGSGGADGSNSEEGNAFELREAYGTYKLPWGGIKLKAGKFVTLLGYEVLMTNTVFNPNISHSILFGYAINFTNVGFLFNVPLGDMAWVDIGMINGWDESVDNNDSKTLMAGMGVKPLDNLTFYLAGTYGGEQNGQFASNCASAQGTPPAPCPGAGSKRGVVTLNGTFTPIEGLSFIMDSVYGNESNLLPDATGALTQAASWYGLVGYVTWSPGLEPVEGLSLNLRAEVFDDADGARLTGSPSAFTPNPALAGVPQTVIEITPTIAYAFNPHILARLEYRYDHSDKPAYQNNTIGGTGYNTSANTIAAELLVAF